MKQFYIALLLCFLLPKAIAQNTMSMQATEVVPNWPLMLSNLNTTQISSGILIDKVTTFSNVLNLNMRRNIF